jgi:hypothetical protein
MEASWAWEAASDHFDDLNSDSIEIVHDFL